MDVQQILQYLQPFIGFLDDYRTVKGLVVFLIFFLFANLSSYLFTRIISWLVKRTGSSMDDKIFAILRVPIYWTVIGIGIIASSTLIELPGLPNRIIRSTVATGLVVTWSVFVGRLAMILLRSLAERAGVHALIRVQTLPLFNNLTMVFVIVLAIYLIFQAWDIDMTAWLASAGIVGIAVGFAAKDTLANLFSGVFILADAPYKIGDYIVLENAERGKVTHIGIRSTRILTRDDVEVTIPNSIMGNTRIVNESGGPHEKFRVRVPVGVAYGSDIDEVKNILMQVAAAEPLVSTDPEPRVRFRRFGASSLDFELLIWAENPELRGRAVDALNSAIYKAFREHKVEIPFAKQDVYIKEFPGKNN